MQVIANIDQADIGLVEQAKSVKFSVDAFPGKEYDGKIQQMRLNPVINQNVVTYNVVIDVNNPEQQLKPGMTANLTITIDERNNVLKVPNAALRFSPPDNQRSGSGGQRGAGNGGGRNRGQNAGQQSGSTGADGANAGGQAGAQQGSGRNFASASAPVLSGQTRVVWILDQNKNLQRRRVTIGLTDGVSTEVVDGDLKEGEMVVTGQTISGSDRPQTNQGQAPGFGGGGAQRGGGFRR
jgi:HlyD family secretion protein